MAATVSSTTTLDAVRDYEALTISGPVSQFGFVPVRAVGCHLFDSDDTDYLDLTAGHGAHVLGHSHPEVLRVLSDQLRQLVHAGWQFPAPSRGTLSRRLARIVPMADPRFLFTVTGSEAVEAALKCARLATGRHGVLSFSGGFHGKTVGALEVTSSPVLREGVAPTRTHLLPMPYPSDPACPDGPVMGTEECLAWIEALLSRPDFPVHEIAGIMVEPVQGARMNAPPPPFLGGLRELTRQRGLLLILDEVYTGFGRTGTMFGADIETVTPDILVLGKALGAGLPIGVVAANRELLDALPPYRQTSTFAGHPLACAAGTAVLDLLADGSILASVDRRERQIRDAVDSINAATAGKCGFTLAVTGRGLMLGLRVLADDETTAVAAANRLSSYLRGNHVLTLVAGSTIKLTPPLTISAHELDTVLEHLHRAMARPELDSTS